MLAIGVLGDPSAPTALALAMPSLASDLRAAGVTTVLPRAVARRLAPLLELTGGTWTRHTQWGSDHTAEVLEIVPLVVEVSADSAVDAGMLRHAARLLRVRPDLRVDDVLEADPGLPQ